MNYREQRSYLNCEKRIFPAEGYGFPEIRAEHADLDGVQLLGFNYALTEKKPEDKVVHFYLDDYQFERVWSMPERYVDLLSRFKAVLTPDFSMYSDFPQVVCMFNHYRKQWCGAYWQEYGITVIPTVGWAGENSYQWCFDGIPKGGTISLSTVGAWKNPNSRALWLEGYHRAIEALKPEEILLVGKQFPGIEFDGKLVTVESPNIQTIQEKRRH